MSNENAIASPERKIQQLLLEYIDCLEQYCSLLRKTHIREPVSVKHLDQFIAIITTLRTTLETMQKIPSHNHLREKKNNRK